MKHGGILAVEMMEKNRLGFCPKNGGALGIVGMLEWFPLNPKHSVFFLELQSPAGN